MVCLGCKSKQKLFHHIVLCTFFYFFNDNQWPWHRFCRGLARVAAAVGDRASVSVGEANFCKDISQGGLKRRPLCSVSAMRWLTASLRYVPFCAAKRCVSQCKMSRFAVRNGPFCNPVWLPSARAFVCCKDYLPPRHGVESVAWVIIRVHVAAAGGALFRHVAVRRGGKVSQKMPSGPMLKSRSSMLRLGRKPCLCANTW